MVRKIRRHIKIINSPLLIKPVRNENLHTQKANVPLNIALTDRISFSVLKNDKNEVRKIENISYEICTNDKWEWVVRYDDHGGVGTLHRHLRISLKDGRVIESSDGIRNSKDKNRQLTWVCNDIKRNYLIYRKKFLKNSRLDRY